VASQSVDPLVTQLLNETKPGEDEHRKRIRRYDRAYKVYRAIPDSVAARQDVASRVRVPLAMQVIDTALVNMVSGNKPRCKVTSRHPDWERNEESFKNVFDYYIDRDHLVEKESRIVQSALIYGIAVGKNHWLYKEGQKTVRQPGADGNLQTAQAPTVLYNGPSFEPWDIYDAWWDPNGRDVNSCAWVALRSWLSKDELLGSACTVAGDHQRHQCDGIYHNVDALLQTGTSQRRNYSAQENFLGATNAIRKDRFEVVEYWHDDRVQVVGNKTVLLRDEPNPHWHGKKPVVMASTRPDLHMIQGVPETELIDHIQQAFWTIHNLRIENEHLTVWRAFTYREGGVTDPDGIEIKPRAMIGVTDHQDLQPIETQGLPAEAFRELEELLTYAQLVTGINAFVGGGPQQGVDQNTATGVSVLSEVSSRLLRFKASQVKWKIWQRTFEQWGADIQQFFPEDGVFLKLIGQGGTAPEWRHYSPDQVSGEFDYDLEGTDDSISKQQDRSDAIALLNAIAPLAQRGIINMEPLIEKVGRAFGFENPQELIQQQPPQGGAAPGGLPPGVPQNGGPPQQLPPGPHGPSNGQIVPGQAQQPALNPQMLQMLSQLHGGNGG